MSIDSNRNETVICRRLLNKILNDCEGGDSSDSQSYAGSPRNRIEIIASDGNWSYSSLINCNYRRIVNCNYGRIVNCNYGRIVKIKKDRRGRFLRDRDGKLLREVTEKRYDSGSSPLPLDCDKHIVDKAETSLVETMNGSIRGRIARFNRRTKSYSKSQQGLQDAVFLWISPGHYIFHGKRIFQGESRGQVA
jgi:hypothetical protein